MSGVGARSTSSVAGRRSRSSCVPADVAGTDLASRTSLMRPQDKQAQANRPGSWGTHLLPPFVSGGHHDLRASAGSIRDA